MVTEIGGGEWMRSFMENGVQDGTLEKPNIKMWAEEEDAAK